MGALNNHRIQAGSKRMWGNYRNYTLKMGQQLIQEKQFQLALSLLLEVCYLDLNGPQNVGILPKYLGERPNFKPKEGFLAPGVIGLIYKCSQEMALTTQGLKSFFIKHNKNVHSSLRCPLSPRSCWGQLKKEL